jgi:Leucine-rich repeat (LRR) protein
MIKINRNAFLALFFCFSFGATAQTIKGYTEDEITELSSKVEDQVRFLEFLLNTVGNAQTSARDKDAIIRESYLKIFRDGKVQVEDDLLLDRKVVTNKDVTAYFKDIEFFYKNIEFKFKIKEVKAGQKENGDVFFLASLDRTITAVGLKGDKISNTKLRFVEVNLDEKSQELKIASIYTTKVSRDEELKAWWSSLDAGWKSYFRTRFDLAEKDTVSLAKLYSFVSVDSLNISGNRQIRQLAPLSELRDLKILDISNTSITNLGPISNVTFLEDLNISNTQTADIKFIKYADKLRALNISGTQIQEISELLNLKNLTVLKAEKTPIKSFAVLNEFKNLKELQISDSEFNDVDNIKELVSLEKLGIRNTKLSNFSAIAQLVSLQQLDLFKTNISDLSPVSNLVELVFLEISKTSVADLSPLNKLDKLKKVAADSTFLTPNDAANFVRSHPNVLLIHHVDDLKSWWKESLSDAWKKALIRANPQLQLEEPNIDLLTQTLNISSLNLDSLGIESLMPVVRFVSLTELSFSNNPLVSDLTPITELKLIREITGKNSGVQNLSILTENTLLQKIDLENSPVKDIRGLETLPKLTYLNVDGTFVVQEEIPDLLLKRPDMLVIYRSNGLFQWWGALTEEWKLVLKTKFNLPDSLNTDKLHQMTATSDLKLEGVNITMLDPLIAFTNLRKLSVFDAPINTLLSVSQLNKLTSLKLSQIPAIDYSPLSEIVTLTELDLSNTGLEDLAPVTNLVNLKKLNVSGSNITSLKGMEALINLEELDVATTDLRSLKALEDLVGLKKLSCFNTKLTPRAVETFKEKVPGCDVRFY